MWLTPKRTIKRLHDNTDEWGLESRTFKKSSAQWLDYKISKKKYRRRVKMKKTNKWSMPKNAIQRKKIRQACLHKKVFPFQSSFKLKILLRVTTFLSGSFEAKFKKGLNQRFVNIYVTKGGSLFPSWRQFILAIRLRLSKGWHRDIVDSLSTDFFINHFLISASQLSLQSWTLHITSTNCFYDILCHAPFSLEPQFFFGAGFATY